MEVDGEVQVGGAAGLVCRDRSACRVQLEELSQLAQSLGLDPFQGAEREAELAGGFLVRASPEVDSLQHQAGTRGQSSERPLQLQQQIDVDAIGREQLQLFDRSRQTTFVTASTARDTRAPQDELQQAAPGHQGSVPDERPRGAKLARFDAPNESHENLLTNVVPGLLLAYPVIAVEQAQYQASEALERLLVSSAHSANEVQPRSL